MQIASQLNLSAPTISDSERQLREFAHALAKTHRVERAYIKKSTLMKHLKSWEQALRNANAIFKVATSADMSVSRASEWMLDNFYVVSQTFRQIEEDLPTTYLNQLPRLDGTALKGLPRVFSLAWEWIGYSQSRLDLTQAAEFVQEYQKVTPLTIGELWAIPSMLRIGILERLIYASSELTGLEAPKSLSPVSAPELFGESLSQFASPVLPNDIIISNCYISLRLLSATDWKDFFEQTSRVERILRNDPAQVYAGMDFNTRNSYRSVIEELARHSPFSEEEVALAAVEFARNEFAPGTTVEIPVLVRDEAVPVYAEETKNNPNNKIPWRKGHVGYFLVDAGRTTLEKKLRYRPEFSVRVRRAILGFPTATYLGSIAVLSVLFISGLLIYAAISGGSPAQLILAGVLGFGLALESAITLVHWIVTHRIKPQSLPRMDFSEGIPLGNRTMVVIPTLLESEGELGHLLQELELYYLSNPDPQLTFALLTDFGDAPAQNMPEDEPLLVLASTGIENLNKKYNQACPFYLFHRSREWNPSEGVWMGWERKRGKLADFNRLLLSQGLASYPTQVGDASIFRSSAGSSTGIDGPGSSEVVPVPTGNTGPVIKYVITLDADTSLPQGSANRLVATLAHPLNHAEFAADGHSVVAGYTVLQPRVAIKPTSANRSPFSQIYSGNAGFDLYSFAVSDVYQDLFGEGSYVGKGIYDVAAFERSLEGQIRENTLLSHDLFEGIYGRAALVTDIVLYEEYPSRYLGYARRLRRWIRGDWQLLPWLFPVVRTEKGMAPNRLSTINKWKIFDNLRRSLLPLMLLALLAAGWLFMPGEPWVWTLLVLLPSAMTVALHTLQQGRHNFGRLNLKQVFEPTRSPFVRWVLSVLFLPYEALLMLGAIGITLTRLLVARKNLLQWTTAAKTARSFGSNLHYETWGEMSVSLALTVLLGISIAIFKPIALYVAIPFLIAWIIAPQIADVISRPITHSPSPLTEIQRKQVLRLARRTWAYFEQFVGPDDHWLPPDHFQESPRGNVAHYTTPTNIGLYLVSTLSAYELGYLGLSELAVRLRVTFESLEKLEHYRGHLLNWYDSQSLEALPPRYISTVDSGNLAASLITVKQGCLALMDAPILGDKQWQGLLAILDILAEALQALEKNNPDTSVESFEVELTSIYERLSTIKNQPAEWTNTLGWLSGEGWERVSHRLMDLLESHPNLQAESLSELQLYLNLMHHQLEDMQRSLDLFAPWLSRLGGVPESRMQPGTTLPFMQTPAWQEFRDSLPIKLPSLGQAAEVYDHILTELKLFQEKLKDRVILVPARDEVIPAPTGDEAAQAWCRKLKLDLLSARTAVMRLLTSFQGIAEQTNAAVTGMDFHFLFDEHRQVFHIGYNASTEQLDPSYYDLLASEARVASLIAIAKGDVPQSHWLHLGRPVTIVNGKQVLLSWSGTMFEYLMPALFTKNYAGTFLSDSCYAALEAQISYGQEKQVPWGISESGYFAFDVNLNYQYRAFGVPDLGYKRDLPGELVVAPYASLMGLSLQPRAVLENMTHLEQLNMLGRYGFYDALDFTKTRLPAGEAHATVQSYMTHHQGMILLATCNYLSDDVMVQRFHSDERIQSVELLLQEKIPQNLPIEYPHTDQAADLPERIRSVNSAPWRVPIDSPFPQVHVLSQGDTSVLITNAGGGYSQWREFALTRWQADTTLDQWGTWIYIQDCESGALWSTTCQPLGCAPEHQEVLFYPHKVEFQRSDNEISLRTGITIGSDGVEIRQVTILNDGDRPRRLKLTSYGEVVLEVQAADRRHPAFNKLFIESEYLPQENALLFQRRLRSVDEKQVVLIHALLVEAGRKTTGDHSRDRAQFLGRSQTARTPLWLQNTNHNPSGINGGTLDPIMSLTQEIDLQPHERTSVTLLTLAAPSRLEAMEKLFHYQSGLAIQHAFNEAQARGELELIEQGLNASFLENIQRLLSALLYPVGVLRSAPHILAQNKLGQAGLWGFGIPGDYPILLVRIRDGESPLLSEALQAYNYWRNHHVSVNLVILNEQDTGYAIDLHNTIQRQIVRMGADGWLNQRDGIFILRTDQLQQAEKILLETVAGVILDENNGTLAEHAQRLTAQPTRLPGFTLSLPQAHDPEPTPPLPLPDNLLMDNGFGGFSRDGREYIIHLKPGQHTPHPWVNVIANPQFGFLVSETGSGCTWAENSGENRLTPWRNDPVTDLPGEALYLRDEETGLVWSPMLMPAGAETVHVIHHGAGYSIFESQSHGLNQTLRLFAASDKPVKIAHLRFQNLWQRPRRITATYYAEWVLGTTRDTNQAHIMPEFDPDKHALLATNRFNSEFGERVAFLAANKKPHGVTTDRTEFLGRFGSLQAPAALGRIGLASAVNAGLDPCAAIQLHVDLAPGAAEEVFFLIGEGANRAESLAMIGQVQEQGQIESLWKAVQKQWDDLLNAITVETPDPGMDLMLNRWLLYQTISCRLWGRSALYQSSGAFGFRDQLQDVLALLHARPALAREQILNAAQRQFEAGDVLHWWHPPSGRGVRTHFSDDMLWLPYVTSEYVAASGDTSILGEKIPFLVAEQFKPEEAERYGQYKSTAEGYSLYEHCRRAIEKGSTSGAHGLPLMGAGDWNDGMNRVGVAGSGESVWLGWFLNATLRRFSSLCELMKDDPEPYRQQAAYLARALELHAWDGNWYLRAFYDDGSRLGSNENKECRIDSIAQSWAVLSQAADPLRAAQAMESVNRLLVREADQLILLLTPPFNDTANDPGYIRGYPSGVRENGGQYTHAAIWTAWAFAMLGRGEHAGELFRMLNPVYHADTPKKTQRYMVEPYGIAADIYSQPPQTGTGGWTWYTGSSGWMYRLGLEAILGITRLGKTLNINPCIPKNWPEFKVDYRFGITHYKITVENPNGINHGIRQILLDGILMAGSLIPLVEDGQLHEVRVVMG